MKSKLEKEHITGFIRRKVQTFIFFEAVSFFVASLIHAGILIGGYEHQKARIAESVIAAVLAAGLITTLLRPSWTRITGLTVQAFALLGTVVGVATIVIGIGPRTVPDVVYHIAIIMVLGWGITVAKKVKPTQSQS